MLCQRQEPLARSLGSALSLLAICCLTWAVVALFKADQRTMSENIPESVPTSQDPRSKRPLKRRALSPTSKHASEVEALFANPDRDVAIPEQNALIKKSSLPPPPEIVANVQGSSAGAGSGEFHVYKASRRREYERLKAMDEENAKELADAEFEKRKVETKLKDESKTEKNRKKREKQKQRKAGKEKPHATGDPMETNGTHGAGGMVAQQLEPVRSNGTGVGSPHAGSSSGTAAKDIGVIIHDED